MSAQHDNSQTKTSSSTSTVTETSTINTVDNRAVQGDNAIFGGNITVNSGEASQVAITTSDYGAIAGGLDVALEALGAMQAATEGSYASAANSLNAVQSVANDSIAQAYDLANEARQSETSGAINNLVTYLFWIAVAGVFAWAVVKTKK